MANEKRQGGWWKDFYENTPFHLYLERHDPQELAATIAFLLRELHVEPGARLFDQCCGMGSLTLPFAQRGFIMTGVDLCESFIARAKADTTLGDNKPQFFVGDAFEFVPAEPCDGAFNWYTSFGYSQDDDTNLKMIQRAFESLKPGAWFALDFMNVPMILRQFQSKMERKLETPEGDIAIVRDCNIDLERGLMEQVWHWNLPDGRKIDSDSTLRIYMPQELKKLFERAGFTEVKLFGGLNNEPLTLTSGRCIIVARRPL